MVNKKTKRIYRTICIVLSVVVFSGLTGCASIAGTFGVASEQYVDEKLSEAEGRLSTRIDGNQAKVDEFAATADQLEALIESVEDAVRTTDELKQLAVVLEERLNNLPVETIKQLVEVLQRYLDEQ